MSHIQLTFVFNLSLLTSIQASAAFNQKKPTVACSLKDENSPFVLSKINGDLLVTKYVRYSTVESHRIFYIIFEDIKIK